MTAIVNRSHQVGAYVDVLIGSTVVESQVPVSAGGVTLDGQAKVRGSCSVTVPDPALAPLLVTDRLSVGGSKLRVFRTVDEEPYQLGVFRIDESQVTDDGASLTTTITGYDESRVVSRARLETGKVIAAGTNYVTAIRDLVLEVLDVEVIAAATTRTTPLLVLDGQSDRWDECLRLAEAIGFVCYFDEFGRLRIEPEPSVDGPPQRTIADGPDGVLISSGLRWNVDGVYNAVIATGDSSSAAPVFGAAYDLDPNSVTYYEGPFGKVPRFYASELLTSNAQAVEAAQAILSRVKGIPRSVTFTMVPDPTLFPGEVVRIERQALGIAENHLLDRLTIPLDATGVAQAATRTQVAT